MKKVAFALIASLVLSLGLFCYAAPASINGVQDIEQFDEFLDMYYSWYLDGDLDSVFSVTVDSRFVETSFFNEVKANYESNPLASYEYTRISENVADDSVNYLVSITPAEGNAIEVPVRVSRFNGGFTVHVYEDAIFISETDMKSGFSLSESAAEMTSHSTDSMEREYYFRRSPLFDCYTSSPRLLPSLTAQDFYQVSFIFKTDRNTTIILEVCESTAYGLVEISASPASGKSFSAGSHTFTRTANPSRSMTIQSRILTTVNLTGCQSEEYYFMW